MGLFDIIGNVFSAISNNSAQEQAWANSREAMDLQHQYNMKSLDKQFEYNKWFVQNAHQNEVNDLRNSGLNPILSANNGQSSSVGLPSAGLSDVNSAVSNYQRNKIDLMSAIADVSLKSATSAQSLAQKNLLNAQAQTELNKQMNLSADTTLKNFQSSRQQIENSNLDSHMKSEIKKNISTAETNYINAYANKVSANASAMNASANQYNAQTNRLNSHVNVAKAVGTGIASAVGLGLFGKSRFVKPLIKNAGSIVKVAPKIIKF